MVVAGIPAVTAAAASGQLPSPAPTAKRLSSAWPTRRAAVSSKSVKKETVADIYTQIAEELRAQYRLGYTPDQATAADGYHQIDLGLKQKGLVVQTRDGYYTGN